VPVPVGPLPRQIAVLFRLSAMMLSSGRTYTASPAGVTG
jgi:hypothetical protein